MEDVRGLDFNKLSELNMVFTMDQNSFPPVQIIICLVITILHVTYMELHN